MKMNYSSKEHISRELIITQKQTLNSKPKLYRYITYSLKNNIKN